MVHVRTFYRIDINKVFFHPHPQMNFDVFRDEIILFLHSKLISIRRIQLNLMLID
jgi:hypothetical protein